MRLSLATVLLSAAVVSLSAAPPARVAAQQARPADAGAQASGPDTVAARIARVEQGLLPGTVVAGRPLPTATLADRMAALTTPGVSVAVINDGVIEWVKAYGVTETGTSKAVTPRTLFQAASISKSVAATAALKLVEQGKLSLDEPVNARLLGWKVPDNEFTAREKVTLRRLLNHSAGLTVHGFGGYAAGTPVPTTIQVLDGQAPANSAAVRADIVPGSLWRYSGGGYTVVQQLLTDVTGKPFPALLAELVLRPLGMNDSSYDQPLPAERQLAAASGHRSNGTLLPGRFHTYPEMAAAGLWTTPTDLATFLIAIRQATQGTPTVLSPEMARQMISGASGGYGLGLSLRGAGPTASFGHGGSNAGFKCQMIMHVASGRGAVVMTNGDQGGRLAAEVLRAVAHEYDWPSFRPVEKATVPVERALLALLPGRYELRPGKVLVVALEGDTLFIIDGPQRIALFPQSPTKFFELVESNDVEFVAGADGRPGHMLIGGQLKAMRLADVPAR